MKEVMRFGKKRKMSYDILIPLRLFECVEQVANRLVLPPNFCGVYLIFHESMFKRYHNDGDYIIKWDST